MNIVITGGAGFLGVRLARALLAQGTLSLAGQAPEAIDRLTLVDRASPPTDLLADARVKSEEGDLNALLQPGPVGTAAIPAGTDLVFHLAAAVSGECEADFDLGMRSNLDATRALLEACRALKTRPVVVFASSLAVFGKVPGQDLPAVIEDDTLPTAKQLRHPEIHRRAAGGRLRAQGLRARAQRAADDGQRASRPAQWRGIQFSQRHDPRAAGRSAGRLPGAGRRYGRAVVTGPYDRRSVAHGPDKRR